MGVPSRPVMKTKAMKIAFFRLSQNNNTPENFIPAMHIMHDKVLLSLANLTIYFSCFLIDLVHSILTDTKDTLFHPLSGDHPHYARLLRNLHIIIQHNVKVIQRVYIIYTVPQN